MNACTFVCRGRNFAIFFGQRGKDHCRQRRLDFVPSFIVSRDIRAQTR